MHPAAIIYIVLTCLGLYRSAIKDGEYEQISFGVTVFSTVIILALLMWGGFFSVGGR